MVKDGIILITWIARIIIAVRLFQVAARTVKSLYWLGGAFVINTVYYIFLLNLFNSISALKFWPITIGLTIAQLLIVLFIHHTFYSGQKSPYLIFFGITLATGFTDMGLRIVNPDSFWFLISVATSINWGWHAVIAYKAYHQVAEEDYVEDWVKARYKLMIAYCACLATTGLGFFVRWFPHLSQIIQSLVGLFALAGVIIQFLVWVMPENFRTYLNRNYHVENIEDEVSLA